MNESTAKMIAQQIGNFIKPDKQDNEIGSKFLRFKAQVQIKDPFLHGLAMRFQGNKVWVLIKYESVPLFCFHCGRMGHTVKHCSDFEGEVDDVLGQWNYVT